MFSVIITQTITRVYHATGRSYQTMSPFKPSCHTRLLPTLFLRFFQPTFYFLVEFSRFFFAQKILDIFKTIHLDYCIAPFVCHSFSPGLRKRSVIVIFFFFDFRRRRGPWPRNQHFFRSSSLCPEPLH